MKKLHKKLMSRSGLSLLFVILLVLILILIVLVSIPTVRYYYEQSQRIGCKDALAAANRMLKDDYMFKGFEMNAQEARESAENAMLGWEDMCPAGGSVYLAERAEEPGFEVVCGIHDDDTKERTRLNANNALNQLEETVRVNKLKNIPCPDTISVVVNSKELEARRTDQDMGIKWGTRSTPDVEGTVLYFTVENDKVTYFCYADEDHCATWTKSGGWTGDSYHGYGG